MNEEKIKIKASQSRDIRITANFECHANLLSVDNVRARKKSCKFLCHPLSSGRPFEQIPDILSGNEMLFTFDFITSFLRFFFSVFYRENGSL